MVNLAVLACVLRAVTKKVINFFRKIVHPQRKSWLRLCKLKGSRILVLAAVSLSMLPKTWQKLLSASFGSLEIFLYILRRDRRVSVFSGTI